MVLTTGACRRKGPRWVSQALNPSYGPCQAECPCEAEIASALKELQEYLSRRLPERLAGNGLGGARQTARFTRADDTALAAGAPWPARTDMAGVVAMEDATCRAIRH
jgi:hypothetical protein